MGENPGRSNEFDRFGSATVTQHIQQSINLCKFCKRSTKLESVVQN